MTDKELQTVLEAVSYVPDGKRDEVTQIILKAASESITLDRLKALTGKKEKTKQNGTGGFFKLKPKEINQMPDWYRTSFILEDETISYRVINGLYQARYRKKGFNIEVSAHSFTDMREKFIRRLTKEAQDRELHKTPLFKDYVEEWLKVKKHTVKESTYKSYSLEVTRNLVPYFGNMRLNEVTRQVVQDFLFSLTDEGRNRTAAKLKQMLSAIFDVACEDYDFKSPMTKIVLSHYEVKKGAAFTKAEEKQLIDFCKANPHYHGNSALLVLMYTGMRVGELKSLTYDGTFITCKTEKTRHGYKDEYRKIPVSPMLKKVLPLIDFEKAKSASQYAVRDAMKRIFPKRHVHELRYTFITRAKECGCNPELVMVWDGHKFDKDVRTSAVDRGYTTYSEEYSLNEINKVDYIL